MSLERVVRENEISINSAFYRVLPTVPIRRFPVSVTPGKLTTGDFNDESNPVASTHTQDDWRGGIGVNILDIGRDLDRCWWSTCQLRHKGHLVLPRLATATSNDFTDNIEVLVDAFSEVYATSGTAVYVYNNTTDSWGSSLRTIASNATDAINAMMDIDGTPTDTLVIANGTDVDYATDSSTWAENTGQAIKYLVYWNDLLWGITQAGRLYSIEKLTGSWSENAYLPLPDDYVTKLFVARGPDREQHIYAATKTGLWIHDADNRRFVQTDLVLPFHPDAGKGATVWRGNIYFPAGNSLYRFQAGSDQTIVTVVGPDLRDGLPSDKRGVINSLLGSHNDLLALVDSTLATGVATFDHGSSAGAGSSRRGTFAAAAGFSSILSFDQVGWEAKWLSGDDQWSITAGVVSNAYTTYRLWWAQNQRVRYMQLPVDVVNPTQITTLAYAASGTHETAWFDGGASDLFKVALSVHVETLNPTTNEIVKVEYARDYVESYTELTPNITEGGTTDYTLPTASSVIGLAFKAWKFRISLDQTPGSSTTTNSPDVIKIWLTYTKNIRALYGVTAILDVSSQYLDVPALQQEKNLSIVYERGSGTVVEPGTLVEVTWRDDNTGAHNYFMRMQDMQTSETSGRLEPGQILVTLVEPRQSTTR